MCRSSSSATRALYSVADVAVVDRVEMRGAAHQVAGGEDRVVRDQHGDVLRRGHPDLEVAALHRLDLGALGEERAVVVDLHVEGARHRLLELFLEDHEALGLDLVLRARGGHADHLGVRQRRTARGDRRHHRRRREEGATPEARTKAELPSVMTFSLLSGAGCLRPRVRLSACRCSAEARPCVKRNVDNRQSISEDAPCPDARLLRPAARALPRRRHRHAAHRRLPPRPDRLLARAQALMAAGCDGIALFGTTGEGAEFAVEDRTAALEALLAAGVPARRLIVSAGALSIPDVARLAAHATDRRRRRRPPDAPDRLPRGHHRGRDLPLLRHRHRPRRPARPPPLSLPLPRHLRRPGHPAGRPPPRRAPPRHHRRRQGFGRRRRVHRRPRPPLLPPLALHRHRDPPARPRRPGRARRDLRPRQRDAALPARARRRPHRLRPPRLPARTPRGRRDPLPPPLRLLGQGGHRRRPRRPRLAPRHPAPARAPAARAPAPRRRLPRLGRRPPAGAPRPRRGPGPPRSWTCAGHDLERRLPRRHHQDAPLRRPRPRRHPGLDRPPDRERRLRRHRAAHARRERLPHPARARRRRHRRPRGRRRPRPPPLRPRRALHRRRPPRRAATTPASAPKA